MKGTEGKTGKEDMHKGQSEAKEKQHDFSEHPFFYSQ